MKRNGRGKYSHGAKPAADLPRLNMSHLQHLSPLPSPALSTTTASERAARLSRLFTLLDAGHSAPFADLEAAFRDVVVHLPGGASLLSVEETRSLLARLDGRHDLGTGKALEMARMLTTCARTARQRLEEYGGSPREVQEWRRLLGAQTTARTLVMLITRGSWMVGKSDVVEAMEALRMLDEERPISRSQSRGSRLNLVLDVVARAAYDQKGEAGELAAEDHVPGHTEELLDPESHPLKPWTWPGLTDPNRPLDVATAAAVFERIWTTMETEGMGFKAFSYASRLKMEGKKARSELLASLAKWATGRPGAQSSATADAKIFGFDRVRQSLVEAHDFGLLSAAHIHEALGQYSKLSFALREAMTELRVDEDRHQPILRSLLAAQSQREAERAFISRSGATAGLPSSTLLLPSVDEQIRQVYEALRWNAVRSEMALLRASKERAEGEAARQRKPTVFEQLFGLTPSLGRPATSIAVATDHEAEPYPQPAGATAEEVVPLLGIPLPSHIHATSMTQEVLIRHYALVSGDFNAVQEVVEDYRSSLDPGVAPPKITSLFLRQHGQNEEEGRESEHHPLRVGTLCSVIQGFSFRGVPFVLSYEEDESGRRREVWHPREDLLTDGEHPSLAWNINHLNTYVEELLMLKPRTAAMRIKEAEREKERQRLANITVKATTSKLRENGPSTAGDESQSRREEASSPATWETQLDLSPSPRQVFFILTALRRCMGDEHDGRVLDVWERLEAKFGYRSRLHGVQETASSKTTEQHSRPNAFGWRGWRVDNRVRRLVDFLKERKEERGKEVQRRLKDEMDDQEYPQL